LAAYHEALTEQLRRLIAAYGYFALDTARFAVDTGENFGEILHIWAVLTNVDDRQTPLIVIDPVRISPEINTRGQAAAMDAGGENPQIMSLKYLISDFYNLAYANIILEMRDAFQ